MQKRQLFPLVFFASCLMMMVAGCGNQTAKTESQPVAETTVETKSAFEDAETYAGTVPCADCEGIEMTLRFSADHQSFELTETYIGKGEDTFVQTGKMNTERGFENDNDATIFILHADKPEQERRYFLRNTGDPTKIFMLSPEKKRIISQLNYSLDKQ